MKASVITEIPPDPKFPTWKGTRCQMKTNMCGRVSRFNFDGVFLCTQHAGTAALHLCIQSQGENNA